MNGEEFRIWRQRLGLTQAQVANKLGVTQRAVAAWESDATPISRQTELAAWAIERRVGLEQELEMLTSRRMTTGAKRRQDDGSWGDVDTTSETIERIQAHIAQIDALVARYFADPRRYGVAFDVGEPQVSTNGYCVLIRNAHKGPIAAIEYQSIEDAQSGEITLRRTLETAIAVTDTRGRTW